MTFLCKQNLSIDTDLHAANGKRVKALDIFAYALAFFKEQALKVTNCTFLLYLLHTGLEEKEKLFYKTYLKHFFDKLGTQEIRDEFHQVCILTIRKFDKSQTCKL